MVKTGNKAIFLIIFFLAAVIGSEYDNEKPPNYEYIQIFKNIPVLFEYLLDMLEERPEILEKNDVTVFSKRNSDLAADNNREERENKENNGISIDSTVKRDIESNARSESTTLYSNKDSDNDVTGIESKTTLVNIFENNEREKAVARNIISNPITSEDIGTTTSNTSNERNTNFLSTDDESMKSLKREAHGIESDCTTSRSINKRDIIRDSTEKQYSTVLHEYGSSILQVKRNAIDENESKLKAENIKSNLSKNKLDTKKLNKNKGVHTTDTKAFDSEKKKNGRRSSDIASFGGSFLTPEEIEEQMIKVEQMLEEHNKNRKK